MLCMIRLEWGSLNMLQIWCLLVKQFGRNNVSLDLFARKGYLKHAKSCQLPSVPYSCLVFENLLDSNLSAFMILLFKEYSSARIIRNHCFLDDSCKFITRWEFSNVSWQPEGWEIERGVVEGWRRNSKTGNQRVLWRRIASKCRQSQWHLFVHNLTWKDQKMCLSACNFER